MKTIIIGGIIIVILGVGCSQTPTGPAPPVLYPDTFPELVEMLDNPAKVATWAEQYTRYSNPYTGWIPPEGKDLAWSLAHDFWYNCIGGWGRGKCGSYAALMVVCSRYHGYPCGLITYYWSMPDGGPSGGHAIAWVQEEGGISMYSNTTYQKKRYSTFQEMQEEYIRLHATKFGHIIFYDEYWENPDVYCY